MKKEERAFERLHALARKGYVAEIGVEPPTGGIVLHHPRGGPDLVLHPDGTLETPSGQALHRDPTEEPDRILALDELDQRKFERFLERLPIQRRKRGRWRKRFYTLAFLVVVWALSIFLTISIASS